MRAKFQYLIARKTKRCIATVFRIADYMLDFGLHKLKKVKIPNTYAFGIFWCR